MKVINCTWELANLGKKVAEIAILKDEVLDIDYLKQLESDYQYLVVKTQPCCPKQYKILADAGYVFIENQISVAKFTFDSDKLEDKYRNQIACIKLEKIGSYNQLKVLLEKMTENMFTTDRIYLDEHFGPQLSLNRYKNWTKTEFEKGTCLSEIIFDGQKVGFILYKLEEAHMTVLLWGLYESFQGKGIGDIIPLVVYFYHNKIGRLKEFHTKVSSNNKGIISKLNNLGYSFVHFEYVFIKHVNIYD